MQERFLGLSMRREEVPQNIIRGYAGGGAEIGIIRLGCRSGRDIQRRLVPVVSTADEPVEPDLSAIVAPRCILQSYGCRRAQERGTQVG